ncbi:MAG: MBL fold metallo-hydrolase [Nitrososphaera sp.]
MKFNLRSGQRNSNPLQIDASKLKERLDNGDDIFILDVRTPEEYDSWRLSYDKHQKTPLIPVDKLLSSQDLLAQIPKDKEIVTLCAHGNRSMLAAEMLSKMGYKARSIRGGMAAWNQVYDFAEVPLPRSRDQKRVRIWQVRRVSKGCMAYVVASGDSATVIDCTCDLESSVLRLAEENGLKIANVVDTHMHADHVSGLSTLVRSKGARGYIGAEEGYKPAKDLGIEMNMVGDRHEIPVGDDVSLTAFHTPGHTEGSTCYALKVDAKTYVFTGDTIFVNGVGRPDLRNKAKEFAAKLYDTYRTRILKYPDDTVVLPGHFDPNTISVKHGELISDTIGSVKRNVKLLSMPKDEFVKFMVSSVPPRPANYKTITEINKKLLKCGQFNMGDLEAGPNSCAIGT